MPQIKTPPAIASRLPGRIRIRHRDLRVPKRLRDLASSLASLPGVTAVREAPDAGSILVHYDARSESAAGTEDMIITLAGALDPAAPVTTTPPDPGTGTGTGKGRRSWRLGDMNRPVKIGMMTGLALSLAGLAGSKRLHALAGGSFVVLALCHMATYRRTLFR